MGVGEPCVVCGEGGVQDSGNASPRKCHVSRAAGLVVLLARH